MEYGRRGGLLHALRGADGGREALGLQARPLRSMGPRKRCLFLSRLCRFGGKEGGDEGVRSEGCHFPAAA